MVTIIPEVSDRHLLLENLEARLLLVMAGGIADPLEQGFDGVQSRVDLGVHDPSPSCQGVVIDLVPMVPPRDLRAKRTRGLGPN